MRLGIKFMIKSDLIQCYIQLARPMLALDGEGESETSASVL